MRLSETEHRNRELLARIEARNANNGALRRDAEQCQKRATALVARTNKNPEDFKRLQAERESLTSGPGAGDAARGQAAARFGGGWSARAVVARAGVERKQVADQLAIAESAKQLVAQELEALKRLAAETETQMAKLRNKELRVRSIAK